MMLVIYCLVILLLVQDIGMKETESSEDHCDDD